MQKISNGNKVFDALTQLRIIAQEREDYLKQLQFLHPAPETNRLVQKAIEYIHGHFFEETCTVQHVKDELRIHDHNFSSFFKHNVHMSIKEYITYHRLVLAKRLLRHKGLSIFQVALEIGYSTHEAFTMEFKKHEGCTPSAFHALSTTEEI
ncbi:helix-turn-helix transcriptional regulator [candidate division KSB1 bacterium]|nr:helix-turn-helix transcriptional regulator [candidate division KSB1 bacterium]